MHTANLERAVRSVPMAVRFAGFTSDTLRLAQAGWELSVREVSRHEHGMDELQLAMRLKDAHDAGIHAISHPVECDRMRAARAPSYEFVKIVAQMGFDIMFMGHGARFQIFPMRQSVSFAGAFNPMDPRPHDTSFEERLEDFRFFRTVTPPTVKDLIVSPEDVPELLDTLLRAQKPLMDKIKARERSRANEKELGMAGTKPRDVVAQILAG